MLLAETTGLEHSFKATFNEPLAKFCDRQLLLATRKFQFDVFAFDEWLERKHPEYNSDKCTLGDKKNVSTYEAIRILYGEDAVTMIRQLVKGN